MQAYGGSILYIKIGERIDIPRRSYVQKLRVNKAFGGMWLQMTIIHCTLVWPYCKYWSAHLTIVMIYSLWFILFSQLDSNPMCIEIIFVCFIHYHIPSTQNVISSTEHKIDKYMVSTMQAYLLHCIKFLGSFICFLRLTNLVYKGPVSKYFWFYESLTLYHNYFILLLKHNNSHR